MPCAVCSGEWEIGEGEKGMLWKAKQHEKNQVAGSLAEELHRRATAMELEGMHRGVQAQPVD